MRYCPVTREPWMALAQLLLALVDLFARLDAPPLLPEAVAQLRSGLVLVAAGALLLAGGAGAILAIRALFVMLRMVPRHGVSQRGGLWAALHQLLFHTTALGLVALGAGLVLSVWWSWRSLGTLTSGEQRAEWMAIIWLVAAMGLLARRTGQRWALWTVGLAILAAALVVLALATGVLWHFLGGI
jgi:hypothetical protein